MARSAGTSTGNSILLQNDSAQAYIWQANSTALVGGASLGNPGPSWHVKAEGDFFDTDNSDIVWQNDDGEVAVWEMNGTNSIGGGSVGNPGPSWHVIGTGDYNGAGLNDILFQNTNGAVNVWQVSGTHILSTGHPRQTPAPLGTSDGGDRRVSTF